MDNLQFSVGNKEIFKVLPRQQQHPDSTTRYNLFTSLLASVGHMSLDFMLCREDLSRLPNATVK